MDVLSKSMFSIICMFVFMIYSLMFKMAARSAGAVTDACTIVSSAYIVIVAFFSTRSKLLVKMECISGPRKLP